jgi:hypothetical protein
MSYCDVLTCFEFSAACIHGKLARLQEIRGFNKIRVYLEQQHGETYLVYTQGEHLQRSPSSLCPILNGSAVVYHQKYNQIIVCAKKCQAYSIASKRWRMLPSMKYFRLYHTVAIDDDYVYAVGGWNSNKLVTACEKLPLCKKSATWIEIASIPGHSIDQPICQDGNVFIFGSNPIMYDASTNQWNNL